jgi:hypothetical protein
VDRTKTLLVTLEACGFEEVSLLKLFIATVFICLAAVFESLANHEFGEGSE